MHLIAQLYFPDVKLQVLVSYKILYNTLWIPTNEGSRFKLDCLKSNNRHISLIDAHNFKLSLVNFVYFFETPGSFSARTTCYLNPKRPGFLQIGMERERKSRGGQVLPPFLIFVWMVQLI